LMMAKSYRGDLQFAWISSTLILVLTALKWSILDRIHLILFLILAGTILLVFVISIIVSLVSLYENRKNGRAAWVPIAINITGILIVVLIPFNTIWLKFDFSFYKNDRDRVVHEVYAGILQPNVSKDSRLIKLGSDYPHVSSSGNEIDVWEKDGKKYIFFYTFRGILEAFSGFVFVPDGGDPSGYGLFDDNQIWKLDKNWYFLGPH